MNTETIINIIFALLSLIAAFLTYVSMTTQQYKGKDMTFKQKLNVYFKICPCGGTIEKWSQGRYYCTKCDEKFE